MITDNFPFLYKIFVSNRFGYFEVGHAGFASLFLRSYFHSAQLKLFHMNAKNIYMNLLHYVCFSLPVFMKSDLNEDLFG